MSATSADVVTLDVVAERAAVVAEARSWLGTPFHHAARIKGAGVDCAQLLLGVYAGLGLVEELNVGRYAPDWFVHQPRAPGSLGILLDVITRECVERPLSHVTPGDILVFAYGRAPSHAAIVTATAPPSPLLLVIHSFRASGVQEDDAGPRSPLGARIDSAWTLRRWAAAEGSA
ncbi:MAG: hydrolase [Gemmatimonadales bacterium]